MGKNFKDFFSPMLLAIVLGGFSSYLVIQGQTEAAMGGVGAAIAAATMKRSKDNDNTSKENIPRIYELESYVRVLETQKIHQKALNDAKMEIYKLQVKLEMMEKEKELELREQEIRHKEHLLMLEQDIVNSKFLSQAEEISSEILDLQHHESIEDTSFESGK